ncbi:IclR family transcriptional regulator domain-containing protein [Actinoplanes regularis]|uniref:Glycerol operon regulatory protein n=1 Tax=Actinoplanes regularis TaxID=52697 RepID=A0A239ER88_9ACTN|nr:IclR family transcriptional regulator C-terminal domain-containing protein [Actinoplanes regularis]GIE89848.1 IclR family transcriptional regulator [Actinoplanes regularis]SNS46553.1 transcriptional regulator, IclR family [Actinoplanes regularis]
MTREPYYVQSLERGLAVIRAFDAEHRELTLSEVARLCGLTRAAARRFLLTLTDLGYVRSDGRLFSLTPRVLELGYAFLGGLTLPEAAEPHMEHLVAEVRESCSLSVLDGDDIVYVSRVPTSRIMRVAINVGTRFPAYATSMGRVLLAALPGPELEAYLARAKLEPLTDRTVCSPGELRAELDRVRESGHSIVDQELEEGLRAIAAPIRDRSGATTGALNVSVHAARATVDTIRERLLPPLLAATTAIENDLRIAAPGRTRA